MTLSYATLTGGSPIEIYAALTAVDGYLNAGVGTGPLAWRSLMAADILAANDDGRSRVAVASTRFIDSLGWQGIANQAGGTTLQWARSGIVIDGIAVDPTAVPALIVQGFMECCGLVAASPSVLTAVDSGSNLKSLQGGTGRLEFFRPTSALDGNATVLPVLLNRLVGRYLGAANPAVAAASSGCATGTNRHGDFERRDERDVDWPL